VRWNFAKFLVGRDGRVVARFDPRVPPEALETELEAALG
jgi:glutathione peroxidase